VRVIPAARAVDSNGDSNVDGKSLPLTNGSIPPRSEMITRTGDPLRLKRRPRSLNVKRQAYFRGGTRHISDADFNSSTGELFLSGRLSPKAAVLAGHGVRSIYLNGVPAAPNTFFCDFNATATYIEYCTVFVPSGLSGIIKVTVQDAVDGPLSNVIRFKIS
jgi:hypothetical protein